MNEPKIRPYPRFCPECGKDDTVEAHTLDYTAKVKHDGEVHEFHVPDLKVDKCSFCSEMYFGVVADEQISAALRKHRHLLSPEEIKKQLEVCGITTTDLATRLRIKKEDVDAWIDNRLIQSGPMDASMRLFFELALLKSV